jgi:hypothetical protein
LKVECETGGKLVTAEQILARLRETFVVREDGPGAFSSQLNVVEGQQQVLIFLNERRMRIVSPLASEGTISVEAILNESQSDFGLVLVEGMYFLSHVVYFFSSDVSTFLLPLPEIANQTIVLQKNLGIR